MSPRGGPSAKRAGEKGLREPEGSAGSAPPGGKIANAANHLVTLSSKLPIT
jgi:hypothetical protein